MSPIPTIVGAQPRKWDAELHWPGVDSRADLGAAVPGPDTYWPGGGIRRDGDGTASHIDGASYHSIAGGDFFLATNYTAPTGDETAGTAGYRVRGFAAGDIAEIFLAGFSSFATPTLAGATVPALGPGASWPSSYRVWWTSFLFCHVDHGSGVPGPETGWLIMPGDKPTHGWPNHALGLNNRGGWGFVGDGAGNWQYASYDRSGVLLAREILPLPAHSITDFNLAEFLIVGTGPGRAAYAETWFNSELIAQRTFASGDLEPITLPTSARNEHSYVLHCHVEDGRTVFTTGGHTRWGRYLRDGTELQE